MMDRFFRRAWVLGALAASVVAATGAQAQTAPAYPVRPVKLVVAFAAGGPIDLAARVIAEQLTEKLGQPFVVENRTGANGAIAADVLKAAAPDGHTMLISNASMITITPTLKKDLKYNVERDFAPVTRIAASPLILVVNPEDPVTRDIRSVADLVAAAKRAPGAISYGSAGLNGNVQQLAFELFAGEAGVSLLSVPFKGSAEAQTALLSKTVALSFDTLTAIPFIKNGKFRPLAVSSRERLRELPDVPTMEELGYRGFDIGFWSGVFMPKGTPESTVNKVSQTIVQVSQDPAVRARLEPFGTVVTSTPAQFHAHIQKETALLADVIRRANIQAE
jgi:tripartite-type tricarboxylate transporter receptor subunit TctC